MKRWHSERLYRMIFTAAARPEDGARWLLVRLERGKTWDNPPCPCIHSDPSFPDLEPGAESVARGRVWYGEGAEPPREGP